MRLDTHLTRLIWALAKKNGGELRLSGYDLDDVPDKCAIVTDYDPATHEYLIQARSGVSDTIIINTGEQWTKTQENSTPSSDSSRPQQPQRSAVLTDGQLAAIEQQILARARSRQQQQQEGESVRARRAVMQE